MLRTEAKVVHGNFLAYGTICMYIILVIITLYEPSTLLRKMYLLN